MNDLHILPVYRTSEGLENISSNYQTFDACMKIFSKKGVVQIFSEGRCINEWHLRPLKKGTARLCLRAWEEGIPLKLLPVGINYSSFTRFGKNIFLNFGNIIEKEDIDWNTPEGNRINLVNNLLRFNLEKGVFEIKEKDKCLQDKLLTIKHRPVQTTLLAIPAILGWLIHAPLYYPVRSIIKSKQTLTDHYDSVMITVLMLIYPFYLLVMTIILFKLTVNPLTFLFLLLAPLCARAFVELKGQLDVIKA